MVLSGCNELLEWFKSLLIEISILLRIDIRYGSNGSWQDVTSLGLSQGIIRKLRYSMCRTSKVPYFCIPYNIVELHSLLLGTG